MSQPIDKLLDAVEWKPNAQPDGLLEGELWATHSGTFVMGEISLRVHRLSNDTRVIDAEDFTKVFAGFIVDSDNIPPA